MPWKPFKNKHNLIVPQENIQQLGNTNYRNVGVNSLLKFRSAPNTILFDYSNLFFYQLCSRVMKGFVFLKGRLQFFKKTKFDFENAVVWCMLRKFIREGIILRARSIFAANSWKKNNFVLVIVASLICFLYWWETGPIHSATVPWLPWIINIFWLGEILTSTLHVWSSKYWKPTYFKTIIEPNSIRTLHFADILPSYILSHIHFTSPTFHPTYISTQVRFTLQTIHTILWKVNGMIFQGVHKNAMQTYIQYKAYFDKKQILQKSQNAITSLCYNLKQIQGSKIPLADFRWIGPYIVEKTFVKNNYLVRKIGTDETQVLHRMEGTHTPRTNHARKLETRTWNH